MAANVNTPTARVEELEKKRKLSRDLMGGTDTMRAGRTTYMPKNAEETDGDYNARLNQTVLYGGFSKTVRSEVGKLFMKPIALNDDVPPAIEELSEDIDGEGRDINSFVYNAAQEGFVDGISYIFVDAPKQVAGATLADSQAIGWSPYWILIKACQVRGWKSQRVGSRRVLSEIRFHECVTKDDGEYGEREVEQVRVLKRGDEVTKQCTFEVFEKHIDKDGNVSWVSVDSGSMTWREILVVPVYINRTGFFEGAPPLQELAELNQEHWASSGEQRHALTFLRFAMLMVTGIDDPKKTQIIIGANQVLKLPKGCDAKYIEHTGKGIEAGEADLTHIEKRMESAHMELRVDNAGTTTATASAIDSQDSNAGLKAVAEGIQDAINLVLQYTAIAMGIETGGSVDVYTGFAEDIGTADTAQLLALHVQGVVSLPTLWKELVRRRILSEDFKAEDEQKLLDDEEQKTADKMLLQGPPLQLNAPPNKGAQQDDKTPEPIDA